MRHRDENGRPIPAPGRKPPPPPPPPPPKGPPNRWCLSLTDQHPYDIVTGDPHIDREIARNRGLYPRPLWWHIRRWWRGETDSMGAR